MSNIHEKCKGCKRIDNFNNCLVYIKPSIWWQDNKYRYKCPLATHIEIKSEKNKKIRVGQQKQRKKF